jgi:NADPH:quinone reductase-like Zn-dependent oxidoreductase
VRAVYASGFGGDDPLANLAVGEQPGPEPRPGWALVRVSAASLNHHDLWTLRGVSAYKLSAPLILGCDAAGRVEAVAEVEGAPVPGARVVLHSVISCASCPACLGGRPDLCHGLRLLSDPPHPGAFADLVAVPAANLIPLPAGVSDEAAACLPTAYLTAYRMLFTRAGLRPGMSVLVQGAGGGVATACILLARAAGIAVHVTSRDPAKRRAALDLGAATSFAPDDREGLRALTVGGGGGVDAVMETVGEATWEASIRAVRPGGTVVVAGATSGPNPPARLNRVFWNQIVIAGSTMGTREELARLVGLCASGRLQPLIHRVMPLAEAASAFTELAAGRQMGKLVLRVGPPDGDARGAGQPAGSSPT